MREFRDVSETSALVTARLSTRERLPYPLLDRVRPTPVGHNRILRPDDLRRDEETGLVEFGVERQGGFWLLMEPAADDPLVHYGGLADELLTSREPMSGFLLQFVISEQSYAVPYYGHATVGRAEARRFVTSMRRVPLQPMRYPTDPTFHYVSPDGFLAEISVLDDNDKVHARHRYALRTVRNPGFAEIAFANPP